MPVKNLKNAYLRVSVETVEQFQCAVCQSRVDLIYIDAGLFSVDSWKNLVKDAHKGTGGFGKLIGLKMPQIWKERTEKFFIQYMSEIKESGFDCMLARNPEEILWLQENGFAMETVIMDSGIYSFNHYTNEALFELLNCSECTATWSQELNSREMTEKLKTEKCIAAGRELIVYGRTPLMVTAQCIRKTSIGCDRRMSLMWLKDRTGALMPVRNCCTFCLNTIYNSVPTVLFDLDKELESIRPDFIRYEFTNETAVQMKSVLDGNKPEQFTRGHFKRGVL